jgi:hypothetical protein
MITLLLMGFVISLCFNAFFVHYLYSNNLEMSFGDPEKKELEILQIAIEKINGIERNPTENPEIAYKESKKLAKQAINEVLAHRNNLK